MIPRRAERFANADLPRPLGDRDQHDVHDADAADQQAHGRDAGQQPGEHLRGFAERVRVGLVPIKPSSRSVSNGAGAAADE